jgi:hypothetical protein
VQVIGRKNIRISGISARGYLLSLLLRLNRALARDEVIENRALRGSLSCVAKKVTKEGHPVGPSVPLRVTDAQSGGAFPEGTSMCRPETSRIVRAALRVFAPPDCRTSTGRVEKQKHSFPGSPVPTTIRTP